jgi:hypothetical protein
MEEGQIKEFVKKENKYFNKIKGLTTYYNDNCDNNIDSSAFPTQGLGNAVISGGATTDYSLTVNISTACSTGGDLVPDTTKKFWYNWSCNSRSGAVTTDIRQITSDQLVKCAIEDFYNQFPNGDTSVVKNYIDFKFFASQGVNVNTTLFDENNEQSAYTGRFLYIDPASTPSNDALNANVSGTSVPNTYYIITVTNGTISAKTQYNTLSGCGTVSPKTKFQAFLGWFKSIAGQGSYFINIRTVGGAISNPASRAAAMKSAIVSWLNSNAITKIPTNQLGRYTDQYTYNAGQGIVVGATLFGEGGTTLSPANGILIYRSDQTYNGTNYSDASVCTPCLKTNAGWAALPATYKFVTYQNGVITQITNMNTL